MIEINFEKISEVVNSEDFRKEICEACLKSTERHVSELHKIPEDFESVDAFEFNVRADLVLIRLVTLIAERVCDGMENEDFEVQMSFVYERFSYFFSLLTKIVPADELFKYTKKRLNEMV